MTPRRLPPFDKYFHYKSSVQAPDDEVKFFERIYSEVRRQGARRPPLPRTFREDFCGTFANCCAWVKRGKDRIAYGIDLDQEPITYGKENYLVRLRPGEQKRLHIHEGDVLAARLPQVDLIAATNFSYFTFQRRVDLLAYFKSCRSGLASGGVLLLDCFGGSGVFHANDVKTPFPELKFTYFWEQQSYDPITNRALFHIHFKREGERLRRRVFTYDWRLWSIPELKEALFDAGFADVKVYWEGTNVDGSGDGEFNIAESGDEGESWVSYLAALR